MTGCRTGRVKLKSGATVIPLRADERDYLQRKLVDDAAKIAGYFDAGDIDGFAVIAWDRTGLYNYGAHVSGDGVIGKTLYPSWLADVARRELVASGDWD